MPDITMCTGEECPRKEQCYRFTATPTPRRQSYFVKPPLTWNSSDGGCDHFYDNGAPDMKKQSGMTLIELLIIVAIVGILAAAFLGNLAGCKADVASAQESANEFMHNIPGAKSVACVATDSDKDGYCSCTVFMEGKESPVAIECGCERFCLNCAAGCKMSIPKMRVRE